MNLHHAMTHIRFLHIYPHASESKLDNTFKDNFIRFSAMPPCVLLRNTASLETRQYRYLTQWSAHELYKVIHLCYFEWLNITKQIKCTWANGLNSSIWEVSNKHFQEIIPTSTLMQCNVYPFPTKTKISIYLLTIASTPTLNPELSSWKQQSKTALGWPYCPFNTFALASYSLTFCIQKQLSHHQIRYI